MKLLTTPKISIAGIVLGVAAVLTLASSQGSTRSYETQSATQEPVAAVVESTATEESQAAPEATQSSPEASYGSTSSEEPAVQTEAETPGEQPAVEPEPVVLTSQRITYEQNADNPKSEDVYCDQDFSDGSKKRTYMGTRTGKSVTFACPAWR